LREVGAQARRTDNDLGKLSRGALAGSGAFRGLGRSIAFASVGFLGGFGLTAAIGGAVKELRNSIRVSAQTVQALRSTGNVAGTTAKAIGELAKATMRKTGVDDEAIKTSANLLLTFTQVRNEVGRGNDIFNQSVKAIVDMSAVIGDLSSNSITLGKALNDPVRGMTALRRIGVSFTAQQIEQVKALMEHGRILQAQKIILREVNTEFGGQAAAQEKATGGLNTLRETVKNMSAELLRSLLPSFKDLVASLQRQVDWLQNTREGQAKLRAVSSALKDVVLAIVEALRLMIDGFKFANRITGSFKHTMELLIALKLATVISGWTKSFTILAGTETALGGTGLAGAAVGSSRLLRSLRALGKLGVITIGIDILFGGKPFGSGPGNGRYSGSSGWGHLFHDISALAQGHFGDVGGGDGGMPAPTRSGSTPERGGPANRPAKNQASAIAATAATQIGIPYSWGGPAILGHSTDCSGLAQAVLKKNGVHVGRTTYEQWRQGRPVDPKHLQPGDLVFFHMGKRGPEHVGIYIGNGQMIEDPHTGASVRVSSLAGRKDFVGARRYIPNVIGGTSAPPQQPGDGYTPHDAASLATPSSSKPKGATPATLISVRAGIDAQLKPFRDLTKAVRAQLSPLGLEAEKHLESLRAHLKKGMSAVDLAQTRAGIAKWGKVLKTEISKASAAATKAAEEAAAVIALALDRRFRDASTSVFRIFDRQTDTYVKNFQRDTEKAIAGMRKAFDRQMSAFDEETRRGLQGFVVPQTSAEGALADFQAARQAEADAKAMADAQASGDPEQIRQLQLDLEERALEQAAKQSREAQDRATDEAQRNYQVQRDAQRAALQEAEDDRERAYQEQRDATLAAYQQQRDDQRQALQDDLDDWMLWINEKKKTWADFLAWLASGGFPVPSLPKPDDDVIQRNLFGVSAADMLRLTGAGGPGAGPTHHLAGGGTIRAPRFLGRGDVIPSMLSAGETVIDRSLTQALEQMVAGGGGGLALTVNINGAVYGGDRRQFAMDLARDMKDEMDRLIGYPNKLG
jgi:NlpC/P60 family